MDKEFDSLKSDLVLAKITVNPAVTNEHVPEIKGCNRVIKERVHGVYCTMPYRAIPPIMLEELVNFSVMWINVLRYRISFSVESIKHRL
eukprot:2337300-Ditylum_brightwellii.AAC.2